MGFTIKDTVFTERVHTVKKLGFIPTGELGDLCFRVF